MTDGDYADVLDRRDFLALTGATGAAALVGGAGAAGAQDAGTALDGVFDVTHEGVTTADPTNVQFNPFNTANQPEIAQHLLFEKYAQYNYARGEFQPAAATDWEFTGDTFEMQLREDLTWSNGQAVTAEDVVTQFRIAEYDRDAVFEWAGGVEADGDYAVVFDVVEPVNPRLAESDVLDRLVQAPRAVYGERLDALENGDAEIADVRGFEDDDPVTNGPFTIADRDEDALVTRRFAEHPDADAINFAEYAFSSFISNQRRVQALLNLNVDSDYSLTVQSDTVADFSDAVEEVQTPDVFGLGLAPNFEDPIAGDRAIRQAIALVMNRQRAVDNSYARVKQAPTVMTPISTDYQEDWLGEEMATYDTYGVEESITEEATSVLEDAGYTVSGGTVEDEDGDQVVVEITTPGGWGDWTLPLEIVVQELNDFGFDARLEHPSNYFTTIAESDFQFIANTWLHGGPTPYPYYSLLHALVEPQQHACHTNYPGYTDQYGGSEADRTVPARNGDGEVTINPADALAELAVATDEETITELVRDLAWLANQDLPRIPIMEKQLQQWVTTDEWDVPDDIDDHPEANVEWAPTWLPRQGDLQYDPGGQVTVAAAGVPAVLARGESAPVTIALDRLPDPLEGLTVSVSIDDPSVALLPETTLADGVEGTVTPTSDRSEVELEVDAVDASAVARVPLATVRVAGKSIGNTRIRPTVGTVATDGTGAVTTTAESSSVVVGEQTLPEVDGDVPIDLDGDGLHEDFNANGRGDLADAVTLFQHREDDAVADETSAYDFSGNDDVDLADVVQLFQSL